MCGPHPCLGRDAFASGPEILRRLFQLRQNASILEQGCAGFSPGSANRCDQFTRHPGRTSSPLRPRLSCLHTTSGLRSSSILWRRALKPFHRNTVTRSFVKAATDQQRKLRDASGSESRREPYEIGRDEIGRVIALQAFVNPASSYCAGCESPFLDQIGLNVSALARCSELSQMLDAQKGESGAAYRTLSRAVAF
jgi:hypothetical protein